MTAQTRKTLSDGDTFTHKGRTFVVHIEPDYDRAAPWEEDSDLYGQVTTGYLSEKKPGQRVMGPTGCRDVWYLYDVAETTRIAKRDGWGLGDDALTALTLELGRKPTKGEIIARAVQNDYEHLRAWCDDEWHYVGVCVRHVSTDESNSYDYAIWGFESNDYETLTDAAYQLAGDCLRDIDAEVKSLRENLKSIRAAFSALAKELRELKTLAPAICKAVKNQLQRLMSDRSAAIARIVELSA